MKERIPAEVFPPGDLIREEIEERGWTQTDLAEILGRPVRVVNEIIMGKRGITPETAQGLGAAFGTDAGTWLNLEAAYQLGKARTKDDTVARRANLYSKGPIKEMVRRYWIAKSDDIADLEKQVLDFFELPNLDEQPDFLAAARKSTMYGTVTPSQNAWLYKARHLARALKANPYEAAKLQDVLKSIRFLLGAPDEIRHVPNMLIEAGVRFLLVEPLPGSKIDGACFWLNERSPVIALSLRYDRIDGFWFTLLHELAHVRNKDGFADDSFALDTDLVGDEAKPTNEKPQNERDADEFATEFLISREKLDDFIARVDPLYSKIQIEGFAKAIGVHPGIVVGQLQHRREIGYSANREMLVKVRHFIAGVAVTDGWGQTVAVAR